MENIFDKVKLELLDREDILSPYACKSKDAILLKEDTNVKENEFRPIFSKDADRIIHSLSYTRYIDKTQVYSLIKNDHITHRVLHVQLVSKIARSIGSVLNLNLDLIEAIALGHDVGHAPFGHTGEHFLDNICKKEQIGYFKHNAQSVRDLKDIEGLNISLQTLDGILAHNGEILQDKYKPRKKTIEEFLEELDKSFTEESYSELIVPMTLEGCVVRISDIIAYIGRDIEDAIVVGSITRDDLPIEITKVLKNNNSMIVNSLIKDIVENSYGKDYISFSREVFDALMKLRECNYKHIYTSKEACKNNDIIEKYFYKLYDKYLEFLNENNQDNNLSKENLIKFINEKSDEYRQKTSTKRMIIDYMAGQTDSFFLRECEYNFKEFNQEKLYE